MATADISHYALGRRQSRLYVCVCVLASHSYTARHQQSFYCRPGTGKGSQILDTGFGIGQIQPMQSQRGLDVSDRRSPPLQSASCLQSRPWPQRHRMQLERSSAHSSVSNTAGERERDVGKRRTLSSSSPGKESQSRDKLTHQVPHRCWYTVSFQPP